jgi:hypothetical protein
MFRKDCMTFLGIASSRIHFVWALALGSPEVVPGYPDRILPVDDKAAELLKKRTLTNLYNQRPAWRDHAHARLDDAVAEAYGWGEEWRAGRLGDDAILARPFALNQARAFTSNY